MAAVLESVALLALEPVKRHRLTVGEAMQLVRAGFFDGKPRMELIEGELLEMAPIGPSHASMVSELVDRLIRSLPATVRVRPQCPIELGEFSLPEPDFALVKDRHDRYASSHPQASDVLAIIEIADTSLVYDRSAKALLYARSGIPVYWLIDVNAKRVTQFSQPDASGYQSVTELAPDGRLSFESLPGWSLAVMEIFPPEG